MADMDMSLQKCDEKYATLEPEEQMRLLGLRDRFFRVFDENVKREGADKLREFLCKSDFFYAPASTRYHGAKVGGLLEHSLNVYDCLCDIVSRERVKERYGMEFSGESLAVAALFHDICKVNFYKESTRNVKDETGRWISVPYYTIEDTLPYGHGEKSAYMLSAYLRLTREEAFAIRYHMGFSGDEDKNNVSKSLEMFPLALFLVFADAEAAFIMEGKLSGEAK